MNNMFTFWSNSMLGNKEYKDSEIDPLENARNSLSHGFGADSSKNTHRAKFKEGNKKSGHVTVYIQDDGAQVVDCEWWTCDLTGDYAWTKFSEATVQGIRDGKIQNHFGIDYWRDGKVGSLTISKIRVKAGGAFGNMCPKA